MSFEKKTCKYTQTIVTSFLSTLDVKCTLVVHKMCRSGYQYAIAGNAKRYTICTKCGTNLPLYPTAVKLLNKLMWQGLPEHFSIYTGDSGRHTQSFTYDLCTSLVNNFTRSHKDPLMISGFTNIHMPFIFQRAFGYELLCCYQWTCPLYFLFNHDPSWYYYIGALQIRVLPPHFCKLLTPKRFLLNSR